MTNHQNAITQRLDRLTKSWSYFANESPASVLRWLPAYDELRMIDVFFAMESSEHGQTPDLFLLFDTPFESPAVYASALTQQLSEQIKNDQEFLAEEGIEVEWEATTFSDRSPTFFLKNAASFVNSLPNFAGLLVIYLQPSNLEVLDQKLLNEWLSVAIDQGIPNRVRFMLRDFKEGPIFEKVQQSFPKQVYTVIPQLDMSSAIQQLAATGNPSDPDVQFRQLFVEMSLKASAGKMDKLQELATKAIEVAQLQGWDHLQVAVHNLVGSTWMGKEVYDQALDRFAKAKIIAKSSYQKQDPTGGKSLLQVLFYEGAALFAKSDYLSAAERYEATVPLAEELKESLLQVEGLRMAGHCYEQLKRNRQALECNKKALIAAETLEEQIRHNSTLPHIGISSLRLLKQLSLDNEIPMLRKKMLQLLGDQDWENVHLAKSTNR